MTDPREVEDDERALVARLESTTRFPADLRDMVEEWEYKREYVHTMGMARDTPDTVATNDVLRAQYAATAALYPRDPRPRMLPADTIPGPEALEGDVSSEELQFIRGMEIIVAKQQDAGRLKQKLRGMIQDTLTEPVTWLKMRWVEDPKQSPLGTPLPDEGEQTTVLRFRALRRDFAEGVFDDMDARHAEMSVLNRTIKEGMIDTIGQDLASLPPEPQTDFAGMPIGPDPRMQRLEELSSDALLSEDELPPTMPYFRGHAFDRVAGEDMRFDWNITRMEDLPEARWMAQRVWMAPSEIAARWNLGDDEVRDLLRAPRMEKQVGALGGGDGEPDTYGSEEARSRDGGIESEARGELRAVWEFWDRESRTVYRWVAGSGRLLDSFSPQGPPLRWFPFFALQFNRVTGQIFGPADSDLLRPLQEEMNMLRTHEREARKSSYPRFMIAKGLLGPPEKRNMRRPIPYSVIEAERAEEIGKSIFPLPTGNFNPVLYEGSAARRDFEVVGGAPLASLGLTSGADLATEVAVADQANKVQNDSKADVINELLAEIYQAMMEVNAQRMPGANALALAGAGMPWPGTAEERLTALRNQTITVDAIPNNEAARKQQLATWKELATVAAQLQLPINRLTVMLEILRRSGVRANLGSFVDVAALLEPPEAPQQSSNNPPANPGDQGGRGGEGGRPRTQDTGQAPAPESVPNRPQVENS
jgi:hypothetical protein